MDVLYRLEALQDLYGHLSYISLENPQVAAQVGAAIRRAIERLQIFPYSGRQGIVAGTYELVVPRLPYIVVYRVRPAFVEVTSILHTSTGKPRA